MNLLDGIKSFWKNASTGVKIGVVSFLLLMIMVVVVSVIMLLRPRPVEDTHINVTNFEELVQVPEDYQTNIQKLMWRAIEASGVGDNVVFADAVVRDGSYSETTRGDVVTARFIIDIESMRYSFAVEANWSKTNPNVDDQNIHIECPHYLDVIYTDTKCIAATPIEQVSRYLPHYEYLDGGQMMNVTMRKYDIFQEHSAEPYLAVEVNACGDDGILSSGKNKTVQWLKSIYLDPNDYYVEVLDTCQR